MVYDRILRFTPSAPEITGVTTIAVGEATPRTGRAKTVGLQLRFN